MRFVKPLHQDGAMALFFDKQRYFCLLYLIKLV